MIRLARATTLVVSVVVHVTAWAWLTGDLAIAKVGTMIIVDMLLFAWVHSQWEG